MLFWLIYLFTMLLVWYGHYDGVNELN